MTSTQKEYDSVSVLSPTNIILSEIPTSIYTRVHKQTFSSTQNLLSAKYFHQSGILTPLHVWQSGKNLSDKLWHVNNLLYSQILICQ